jgi:putative OPT family oligopeptide transporter
METLASSDIVKPYISPSQTLPEITIKAFILGILLAVIMAGSNAYLGLKIGMTVSATIPAAVISMAILRFFRQSNILENNIVQTAASAGEVVAAGVVFTLPALIMLGYWEEFPFFVTASIVSLGGILGVLFSIPLRRAFIIESNLKFPEGVATAEVLKAGHGATKGGAKDLLMGGIFAALVKFSQTGLMIFGEGAHYWTHAGRTIIGFGTGLSPVLMGAGYIVGPMVGASMLVGAIIAWVFGVPIFAFIQGLPEADSAYTAAVNIWNSKIRMIGVGTMVIGGLWTLVYLIKPIMRAVSSSFETMRKIRLGQHDIVPRTELDIPMKYVFVGVLLLIVPLFIIFNHIFNQAEFGLTPSLYWTTIAIITSFSVIVSFICASIAGYMAGLIGSSNNPISGVTIIAVLSAAILILFMLGDQVDFNMDKAKALSASGITIILGGIMACAAALSNDTLQDLKSGQLVGATPWKQQLILLVGVFAGAIAITPVLQVLYEAYGIGNIMPRGGMDPAHTLAAPKAAIMAAIAEGIFARTLDWSMFALGGLIGGVVIIFDEIFKRTSAVLRLPVLAVALGIYMPLDISVPVFLGGMIAYFADKALDRQRSSFGVDYQSATDYARRRGLLLASGLIAGEALVGIALAIPFAAYQSTHLFSIVPDTFAPTGVGLGSLAFFGLCYYLYKIASQGKLTSNL